MQRNIELSKLNEVYTNFSRFYVTKSTYGIKCNERNGLGINMKHPINHSVLALESSTSVTVLPSYETGYVLLATDIKQLTFVSPNNHVYGRKRYIIM